MTGGRTRDDRRTVTMTADQEPEHGAASAAAPAPAPAPATPPGWDAVGHLAPGEAEALVRMLEGSLQVRRRYQFFVWTQSHLHALIPHTALACGSYQRQRKLIGFEAFYSVVLSAGAINVLTQHSGELLRAAAAAWTQGRGSALALGFAELSSDGARREAALLQQETGCKGVLVHGVARPQRPSEIESLYLLLCPGGGDSARALMHLDLVLPTLQMAWQRVLASERELRAPPVTPATTRRTPAQTPRAITPREVQILNWVRLGRNNQQIGEQLGISPLTVKNHIQKILRKLGAANRAQAVALAMTGNLLGSDTEGAGR